MPFFLEQFGLKLATFVDEVQEPAIPIVDPIAEPQAPKISALGFELLSPKEVDNKTFDPEDKIVRTNVFASFNSIGLFVKDTKLVAGVNLRVSDADDLIVVVPTINHLCSKLHVEDISPLESTKCNHESVKCVEVHYPDDCILIEPTDYLPCDKKDASFRIIKHILHLVMGSKWISLSTKLNLQDGYYTLDNKHFI